MWPQRGQPQNGPENENKNINPANAAEDTSLHPSHGQMRVCWYDRVVALFRFISVAVPMFVLDILFQLHILQPKWKGTMANDRAVADGLNGYESFRSSAHEYSIVSFGLGLKLSIRGFVENTFFRCIFDRSIRCISNAASHREQD